jgi:hypothetical protein
MDQISAPHKKLVAGSLLYLSFVAKLIDALQQLS